MNGRRSGTAYERAALTRHDQNLSTASSRDYMRTRSNVVWFCETIVLILLNVKALQRQSTRFLLARISITQLRNAEKGNDIVAALIVVAIYFVDTLATH